ncbi:hypothetical protein [Desulfonatronovibrio magnus]|uniref:hypothetical protein n=1 Tax=Desulfonatronovibrio magnus TaxID=698827 RepID=UPI0012F872B7|nr:hypothetical protein [Desulfonatronovibrio magnus]
MTDLEYAKFIDQHRDLIDKVYDALVVKGVSGEELSQGLKNLVKNENKQEGK